MMRTSGGTVILLFAACLGGTACGDRTSESAGRVRELAQLVQHVPAPKPEAKLTDALRARLAASAPNEQLRVLVALTEQLDLNRVGAWLAEHAESRGERRRLVIAALHAVADRGQTNLHPLLEKLRRSGEVESYVGFSVVNQLQVVAIPAGLRALAANSGVAALVEETERDRTADEMVQAESSSLAGRPGHPALTSWAIAALGADSAWRVGLDGRGVVVGIIDPGVSAEHEQLRGGFRGGDRSWLDPTGRYDRPHDILPGHGTSVLSVAVGQGVGGVVVGVAPGATWIACVGLPRRRINNVLVTACADWMLNVGQPDVLVAPWTVPESGCDMTYHRIVSAWRAAEIFPVFAAGNRGPGVETGRSPANYAGLYPGDAQAFAVGGTAPDGEAYESGSRGPGGCGTGTYPVVVAPAQDVPAALALTPSSYARSSGTSLAAGLAAGAVAILLQRHPDALVTDLELALVTSAVDAGSPGADNTFGYGRLNIPRALRALGAPVRRASPR
jgi:bacillopeptidase F